MRGLPRPPLLLITDAGQARRPLLDVVAGALAGGCRWISLREKALAPRDRAALLSALLRLTADHGATVMVHGDVEAAAATGAHGVHLKRAEAIAPARARLGPRVLIGLSAHDGAQIAAAAAAGADYVTLSPVFLTASKPGYGPALGLARFAALAAASALPVLALGGVDAAAAGACRAARAAGVAVMGEIMRSLDPAVTTAALISELARACAAAR